MFPDGEVRRHVYRHVFRHRPARQRGGCGHRLEDRAGLVGPGRGQIVPGAVDDAVGSSGHVGHRDYLPGGGKRDQGHPGGRAGRGHHVDQNRLGLELDVPVQGHGDVLSHGRRGHLLEAAGNGGSVYSHLLHHVTGNARQVLVVGLLDAAHPHMVDVDAPDRGQRGAITVGMLAPGLGDDLDAVDSQAAHLFSNLRIDLADQVAERALALQIAKQCGGFDPQDLGEALGGSVRIFDDAGIGNDGRGRQRQGDGPAVAVEHRAAGRRHDDLAEGDGHLLQDPRVGSGLNVDDAVDESPQREQHHHQHRPDPASAHERAPADGADCTRGAPAARMPRRRVGALPWRRHSADFAVVEAPGAEVEPSGLSGSAREGGSQPDDSRLKGSVAGGGRRPGPSGVRTTSSAAGTSPTE